MSAPRSRLPDPYESPGQGLVNQFRNILIYAGIPLTKAEGVVLAYTYTDMNSLSELKQILTNAGCRPNETTFILDLWGRELKRAEKDEGTGGLGDSAADPLTLLSKKYLGGETVTGNGGATGTNQALLDRDRALDWRRIELGIKEKEFEIARIEADLVARRPPGQPLTPDADDMVTVTLNVNGMPVTKRVKFTELGTYTEWMPKHRTDEDEPPAWARGIIEQNKTLQARLDKEDEERRQRERDDKWEARFARLEGSGGGGNAELKTLREEWAKEKADREKEREDRLADTIRQQSADLKHLEDRLEMQNDPEYAQRVLDRKRQQARGLGMVSREEVGTLTDEQIQLKAKADAEKVKTEAQTELVHVITDKAKNTGAVQDLVHGVVDAGAPAMIVNFGKKLLTPDDERGAGHATTPEEIGKAAEALEAQHAKEAAAAGIAQP